MPSISLHGFAVLVEVKQAQKDRKTERHQGQQQRRSANRTMAILASFSIEQNSLDKRHLKHE
ncbi:hypothetical protein ACEN8I_02005 [Polaromonas sp. CT11-55]|uniref:hypothetical protein n=1 Tax=Polaromonas sp. CT11-55 TaxID=3243045 RepID=UPI0039A5F3D1